MAMASSADEAFTNTDKQTRGVSCTGILTSGLKPAPNSNVAALEKTSLASYADKNYNWAATTSKIFMNRATV